jgi:transcriptional regulator with XRE-family HTH domain
MSTKKRAAGSASPAQSWSIHNPADIGRAIAGVRAEKGLTQSELAAQLEVDRGYLARLEAGASQLVLERSLRALRRMGARITVSLPDDDEKR